MIPPKRGLCIQISHLTPPNRTKHQILLNAVDLAASVRGDYKPDEQRRWQALYLLATGSSMAEVVATTSYSARSIRQLVRRYLDLGNEALVDRRAFGQGATPILSTEAQLELSLALQGDAPDGGKWTSRKVAQWMAQKTGKPVHRQRGWDYLQRLRGKPGEDQTQAKVSPKGDSTTSQR